MEGNGIGEKGMGGIDATSDTLRLIRYVYLLFLFLFLSMFWNIILCLWVNVFYLLVFGSVDVSDDYSRV